MQKGKKKHEQDSDLFQICTFISNTNSSSNKKYYLSNFWLAAFKKNLM